MLRRIIAITVIVVGLAAVLGAVGSATIWRPDDRVTATLPAAPQEPVVITAPGVLDLVDETVDVRVVGQTPQTPVVVAMGREADVRAWIGDAPHLEITGLSTWEELSVRQVEGAPTEDEDATEDDEATQDDEATEDDEATQDDEATEDEDATEDDEATQDDEATEDEGEPTVPDPAGSDLWIEEVTGTGELTYEWAAVPGRWVMLVASDGDEPAPQVELTWDREVPTPLLVPGLIIGAVLVLAGGIALVLVLLSDREAARARKARVEQQEVAAAVPAPPAGRHREQVPEENLTYAQRLGWPSAEPLPAAAQDEQPVPAAAQDEQPADERAASPLTSSLTEDGTPLTRRQLREQEKARLEAERAKSKFRWWPFGAEDAAAQSDSESAAQAEPAPQTRQEREPDPHTSGARWRRTWGIAPQPQTEQPQTEQRQTEQSPGGTGASAPGHDTDRAAVGGTREQDAADTQSIPRQTPPASDSGGEEQGR